MPRRNPTGPGVSLVAVAFRDRPELLRELRAAGGQPTLDFASQLLAEWTDQPYEQVRQRALTTLARYARRADSPASAVAWLQERDYELAQWVAAEVLETRARKLPLAFRRALKTFRDYLRGKATPNAVDLAGDDLDTAAYPEERMYDVWAMTALLRSMPGRSSVPSEVVGMIYLGLPENTTTKTIVALSRRMLDKIAKGIVTYPSRI